MNALPEHVLGKSAAQDRLWAQVNGLAPDRAVRTLIVALQFQVFIDDSYSDRDYVLGGYVASAETWASFAKDWEELLPMGLRHKNGNNHFKMSEMALNAERLERVQAFYRVIESHGLYPVSIRMNFAALERATKRFDAFCAERNWIVDFGPWLKPHFRVSQALIANFYEHRDQYADLFPLHADINFIFDNQTEKSLFPAWQTYLETREEGKRAYFGQAPSFEDDQKFLPLQAADFWAWWVREWIEKSNDPVGVPPAMREGDYGLWRSKDRPVKMLFLDTSEDQMLDWMQRLAIEHFPSATRIDF